MYRGWLTNPDRKKRQGKSLAFNENDVQNLLSQIDDMPFYVSKTLGAEIDRILRLRDKALIATGWIWFKRASEILGVKRKDVYLDERKVYVTFHIRKKSKRYKICPSCETKSGFRAKFCRECKNNLSNVPIEGGMEEFTATKNMTLNYRFTKPIVEWLETFDKLTENLDLADNGEAWFFPALQVSFNTGWLKFYSESPMTVQNFDRILQRLDPSITSSFFRYFRTEQLQVRGYTNEELKQIGDWSSSHMPEVYAKRRGLTPALRRFGDNR
jgi:integrase